MAEYYYVFLSIALKGYALSRLVHIRRSKRRASPDAAWRPLCSMPPSVEHCVYAENVDLNTPSP
jgi:hypothetical protein